MKNTILFIAFIVLISGCVQEQPKKPVTQIVIPEHPFHIYEFSYNIRDSLKIKSNEESNISSLVRNADTVNIIFNGTVEEDNGYFAVTSFNIIEKLQTFFSYEQKFIFDFPVYYFENSTWHNRDGETVENPDTTMASVWLLGPNTGAIETSVNINGNIIYVQGTTGKNVVMAGDRLVLIVIGIDEKDLE